MSRDIKDQVENCETCIKRHRNKPEPLLPTPFPERPWQKCATDMFHFKGKNYVLVVDYYSRYIEVKRLSETSSADVINSLKGMFARHGLPDSLVSDNGPQYSSSEFKQFVEECGICHLTSSPNHPSANGEAERAVRTVKGLLTADDPFIAFLNYRSSPLENGYSPAELLMGRKLRTKLPSSHDSLKPTTPDLEKVKEKELSSDIRQKLVFDQRHTARNLPELSPGDPVWIKDREEPGVVKQKHLERSFIVKTPKGTFRRNRVHLNKMPSPRPGAQQRPPTPLPMERSSSMRRREDNAKLDSSVKNQDMNTSVDSDSTCVSKTKMTSVGSELKTRSGRKVVMPAKYEDFIKT